MVENFLEKDLDFSHIALKIQLILGISINQITILAPKSIKLIENLNF